MTSRDEPAQVYNGWRIYAHPVFAERVESLTTEVRQLKAKLPPQDYVTHPTVKLTASVTRLMTETVPLNPNARGYWLDPPLEKFRRAKGHGLPPRYRMFWCFSEQAKVIIYLYLNDEATLRHQGAKSDPYERFKRMVDRGDIGSDFTANQRVVQVEQHGQPAPVPVRRKQNKK